MDIEQSQTESSTPPHEPQQGIRKTRLVFNIAIGTLIILVGYLSYAFIFHQAEKTDGEQASAKLTKVIQLDVLNGCGANGVGAKFTGYLRQHGFDVVEMKNYKTSNVTQTLVIDRVGDLATARRVAASLGVSEKNIIQQLNPDYFVDVSVVIGGDYQNLPPNY